ncbi:MAG: restriction endonuclease subunit S [Fibrella sp.]|nr:restriction endonuclease subunit S [Armatimonadota bacterium]
MSLRLPKYPEYKDSGVEWMEPIPAHWKVRRAKNLFRCIDVRSKTGEEEMLTVSSKDGVVPRRTKSVTMFMAASYVGHKLCWPGDLVINSLWAWAKGLGFAEHHGVISSAYGVYRLSPQYAPTYSYFNHLLRSRVYDWELQVRSKGIWISRLQLTDDDFLKMPLIVPPVEEQAAIVRFLDALDRRVNRLLRIKRRLIVLLNEQKQAIIHGAVTKGLNPDAPMKPSGIEWFPAIPRQWNVVTLRRVIHKALDGPHVSPNYVDEGVPFISARNVKVDRWSFDDAKFISQQDFEVFSKRVKPEVGDVLYTKGGTTGIARCVDLDFPFQVWVHVAVLKVNNSLIDSDYLALSLNSSHCYEQSQLLTRGATNQDLGLNRMKEIIMPLPPTLQGQRDIVDFLSSNLNGANLAISRTREEIELIREYRTRLIADVVTGKLDVRDAILPDAFPDSEESAQIPLDEVDTLDALDGDAGEDDAPTDDEGEDF